MGIFDTMRMRSPMMRIPTQREQIPQMPGRQQAMGSMGQMGSQGLFEQYMQNLFKQKYAPQQMQGGVQNFGGFMGFGSPQMAPLQQRAPGQAQQPGMPVPGQVPDGQTWGSYWGAGG